MHLETQVAERTQELLRKNEQIVEMERLKTGFFTNVSHEIRTPLSLISGPLDNLIKQDHPDPKTARWLSMIDRNSERLLQLVNQLLDISKLDSGKMKLVLQESDVLKHLRMLVNGYLSMAEIRRIRYVIDVPEKEQKAWYDREKVEKVCTNLLSNAFKFTPEYGVITCRVKLLEERRGDGGINMLRIIVADTGPGIPLAEREKIFERFYRAESDLFADAGGTGIGLSLTRELIGLMHGEVVLKSLEGSGAVFIVTLPLGKDHLEADEFILKETEIKLRKDELVLSDEMEKAVAEQDADHPVEVLIVEDNEDIRNYIRESFSGTYQILEAEDGITGLNLAQSEVPDLIISDVMMPGMDGMELCRTLKRDERTSHIPVILLTAKSTSEDKIEGLEFGADDYIFKPFQIKELSARIRNLLEQRDRLKKKYSCFIDLGLSEMTVSSLDEQFLKKAARIIEESLSDFDFDVGVLQDKMAMSRSQFFRKMKALTGKTPVQLIRLMRLKMAAKLIESGKGTITEILMSVGFSNPSYFAKCFKEKYGVSPKVFQKAHVP
jgi:DNA-binding response OmpR family regulator/nitrogen-specific signal transduction histidine kinase